MLARIGTRFSKSSYDLTIQGPDTADLFVRSEKLEKEIATLPAVTDVTTDLQLKNPRVNIAIMGVRGRGRNLTGVFADLPMSTSPTSAKSIRV